MRDYPFVSLIVVNYNGLKFLGEGLRECLESILKTDYPSFDLLFVDNGSADGSVDFVKKNFDDPRLIIIQNKGNLGFAEGSNVGIRVSKGEYVVLLNNDIVVDPHWLKEIIRVMEPHPNIGIAGCKVMIYGSENIIDYVGAKLSESGRGMLIGHGEKDKGNYDVITYDFDYVSGAAIVVRRKVLARIGLLDPDYFIFYEETDLCYRAREKGYKIAYVPKAIVWHKNSATFSAIDPSGQYKAYMLDRSRFRFIIKNYHLKNMFTIITEASFLVFLPFCSKKRHHLSRLKALSWNLLHFRHTWKSRVKTGHLTLR